MLRLGCSKAAATTTGVVAALGRSSTAAAAVAGVGAVRAFGHAHPHPKHKAIPAPHKPRVTQLLIDGKVSGIVCLTWHGGRQWPNLLVDGIVLLPVPGVPMTLLHT